MANTKKVTGVDGAVVNVKPLAAGQPPGQVFLRRGDALPGNVVDGEVERLKALGVFDDPAVVPLEPIAAAAQLAALEAELSAATVRAEAAEKAAQEAKDQLAAAKKAAPSGSRKVDPPNPANPVPAPPPATV